MIGRLLRAPVVHFLFFGACLMVAQRRWAANPPTSRATSDEELLYQAALALGVDGTDQAVRQRLARLGRFVGEDRGDEAALEAEARRLGLERNDLIIRRHLAQMMQLAAGRLDRKDLPTDDDLRRALAARTAELTVPDRVRFTHVYLSRARHGATLDADARRVLDTLRSGDVSPDRAATFGDAFITGSDVGPLGDADLDRRFGAGFGASLANATTGTWAGPVASSYGLHLVWVHERLPATMPDLDAVRGRLLHQVLRERREARAHERLAALRARRD